MVAREPLTDHPEIIRQWDHEKNTIDPTTLSAGSGWIQKKDLTGYSMICIMCIRWFVTCSGRTM